MENTLTVSGDLSTNDKECIKHKIAGLTIHVEKDVTLAAQGDAPALSLGHNTTITGSGKLTLTSEKDAAIYVNHENSSSVLTLKDADIDASGQWGITGPIGNRYQTKLVIANSTIMAKSKSEDGAICDFRGGITLSGSTITVPEGGRVDGACIVDADGNVATEVVILAPTVEYDLWVGGIQVTNKNQDDIQGDGTVSYIPANQTLVLKGATVTGREGTASGAAVYSKLKNLTIRATGQNQLTGAGSLGLAMYLLGTKNTVTSSKVLNPLPNQAAEDPSVLCRGTVKLGSSSSLSPKDTLILNGNVVLAVKGDVIGNAYGKLAKPTSYSTLSIAGKSSLICGKVTDWAGLIMTKSHVISKPAGGVFDSTKHAVCDGKTIADAVEIRLFTYDPADVNRDGTVDSADIVAVIKEMPDGDKKADVNGDSAIDSADIVAVIKAMK